ncbi:peptidase MA family metallohydrolase [Paenisporosarcina sp.]|uniref:peptidase MA family metallohydrolase n=1 Tax=Paenisporosarcina sp. TaxID=1932001 RepID=UPI003C721F71
MSKKKYYILLLLIILLLIISVATIKYKENITHLLSSAIIGKIVKEEKEELISDFNKKKYEHLLIYYSESDRELIPATKESLKRAMELNNSLFGPTYTKPYDVIIFSSTNQIESFSGLEYAIGIHSPEFNMIGILPENKEGIFEDIPPLVWNYKSNIMHEYTHYVFTQKISEGGLSNNDIPLWFSEGVAEYVASDGLSGRVLELGPKVVSLNELSTFEQWNTYRTDNRYDVYLQSEKAIYYLINEYGIGIIDRIILETNSNGGFEEGLQRATNINIKNLDEYIETLPKKLGANE